jgi:lysophospholipase L1-like esterase
VPSVLRHRRAARTAIATALALIGLVLIRYTSHADRRVFGRWSLVHFGLIVVVLALLAWVLYRWARRAATAPADGPGRAGLAAALGLLAWSAAFFIDGLEDPTTGGRLLDLRVFSSVVPVSILLEWVAMALLAAALVVRLAPRLRPSARSEPRRAGVARNLLLVGISVAVAGLALEGVLRLRSILAPEVQGFPTRAQACWTRRFVRLNSLGYRDVEHAREPDAGIARILLIGDSVAYGAGIDDPRARAGDLLEQTLNRAAGTRRFEVVQGARVNTHTLHHIAALRRLLALQPRYVLLLYFFNDIEHVVPPPVSSGGLLARIDPLKLLLFNSVAAEQVFIRARRAYYARVWQTLEDPYANDALVAEHLAAVAEFFRVARTAAVEARLVPMDVKVRLDPGFGARYRRFEQEAVARGIRVWSLEHAFDPHPWPALVVNPLDNHPNERAHALMARAIAERFQADFGLGPPSK